MSKAATTKQPKPLREPADAKGTILPDSFPFVSVLRDDGFTTYESLMAFPDLEAIDGIGEMRAKTVRHALDAWVADGKPSSQTPEDDASAPVEVADGGEVEHQPISVESDEGGLPLGFPCREELHAAGHRSIDAVRRVGDLTAIPGVRNIDIRAIRKAAGWK